MPRFTHRLPQEQGLLENKVLEEARELVEAKTHDHITAEAADVIYFALVYCARAGVSIADIEKELDRCVLCFYMLRQGMLGIDGNSDPLFR